MHATLPLLQSTEFPHLSRHQRTTLQVNLGFRSNAGSTGQGSSCGGAA